MRTLLRAAPIATLLLLVACGGASKSVRTPTWVGSSSGTVDDDGKWYWQIEKVNDGSGLKRRLAVDKKVREALAAACKDVKPEDAEIVDHYVDGDSGSETAIARIDSGKCPDAPESKRGGASADKPKAEEKAEEKPAEEKKADDAKPAEGEKPAEEKPAEEKPAEEAK